MEAALIEVGASHVYPGAAIRLLGAGPASRGALRRGDALPCIVLFADGTSAHGSLATAEGRAGRLTVGGHVTARGTAIAAKSWRVSIGAAGAIRVLGRADPDAPGGPVNRPFDPPTRPR